MYTKIEKPKENKRMAIANSVAQNKNKVNQLFKFVDNRSEYITNKKLQDTINNSNVVQKFKYLSNKWQFEKQNDALQTASDKQKFTNISEGHKTVSLVKVIQGDFYDRDPSGTLTRKLGVPGRSMKPWIDPMTGNQAMDARTGLAVYFNLEKAGLERQKHKGSRINGKTTGVTLGDEAEYNRLGMPGPWPGSRTWPAYMQGAYREPGGIPEGSAKGQRDNLGMAPHSNTTSWGHQVAMQWGGPANLDNAVSATNDAGAGANAQEEYQTIAEDAVNRVVQDNVAVNLSDFRLKHTAYKYPGTNVAKYVRFKIYKFDNLNNNWVLVVDQATPDFAQFLAGGRGQVGSARRAFQLQLETQLTGLVPAHGQKKGTDTTVVRSWASIVDRGPIAKISHPSDNEIIHSENYSINIEANAVTNNVEVLIQRANTQGIWNQTRQTSDGTWWYDWHNIQDGSYEIQPRAWKADGQMVEGNKIRMTKRP